MGKVDKELQIKLKIFQVMVALVFFVLLLRLGNLQLIEAQTYHKQSEQNRIRVVSAMAPRGEIVDRNNEILAQSKLVHTVSITYLGLEKQEEVVEKIAGILGEYYPEITAEYVQDLINSRCHRLYEPVVIKRDINFEVVTKIEERRSELPGIVISTEPLRYYSNGPLAGHILGYVREISADELEKRQEDNYRMGDLIGKVGLERYYEEYLRGKKGFRQVEVDAGERPIRELMAVPPVRGNQLQLTLDSKLQHVLEEVLDQQLIELQKQNPRAKSAAVVVLDVRTGQVLAMASRPAMDPNDFIGSMDQSMVDYYFRSKPEILLNRSISAVYPPGSTFKMVTGIAALTSGKISVDERVNCQGAYWQRPNIKCWQTHGPVNFYQALAHSCNVYFQEAAYRAGIDAMVEAARSLGLGKRSGIDLPGEAAGLLPTPKWKRELNSVLIDNRYEKKFNDLEQKYKRLLEDASTAKERQDLQRQKGRERRQLEAQYKIDYNFETNWQPFDTFNMSIGQGSNTYTPLQLANYVATIANGGQLFRPYLVEKIKDPEGNIIKEFKPKLISTMDVQPSVLADVKQGMRMVTSPGGTAYYIFHDLPVEVAAKTGTAQTGQRGDQKDKDYHGVFVAFAPYENPEIAFASVIEYGYHGGSSGGPIAKEVFKAYFGLDEDEQDEPVVSSHEAGGQVPAQNGGRQPESSAENNGDHPEPSVNNGEEPERSTENNEQPELPPDNGDIPPATRPGNGEISPET